MKYFPFRLLMMSLFLCVLSSTSGEDLDISKIFSKNNLKGTMVISSLDGKTNFVYNEARAHIRFVPASTFKILNTLIALETSAVADEKEILKWDGVDKGISTWNKDQTIETAFPSSCVWFYQELARRIGSETYITYLKSVHYGNELFGPIIDRFWLDGDLEISAAEQISFLNSIYRKGFPFKSTSYDVLSKVMIIEESPAYIVRGKTGWSKQIGWIVGYVESKGRTWFFATNLDIKTMEECHFRKEVTFEALRAKKIIE